MSTEILYLAHYGVKGMRWGVRKSPADRALHKSAKYANKSARLHRQVSKLKKKELKYEKKELKAVYRGNQKGQHVYRRKKLRASVKAHKKEAKAAKFSAKSQAQLSKSLRLKASHIDTETKNLGKRVTSRLLGYEPAEHDLIKESYSDIKLKDKSADAELRKLSAKNPKDMSELDELRLYELTEDYERA